MDGLLTYCVGSGVVEEKDLVDCKEGEAGELLVQGPGVFAGTLFSFNTHTHTPHEARPCRLRSQ